MLLRIDHCWAGLNNADVEGQAGNWGELVGEEKLRVGIMGYVSILMEGLRDLNRRFEGFEVFWLSSIL